MSIFGNRPKGGSTPAPIASAEPTDQQNNETPQGDEHADAGFDAGVLAAVTFLQSDACKGKELAAANLLGEGMSTAQAEVALKHIPVVKSAEPQQNAETPAKPKANSMANQFSTELAAVDTEVGAEEEQANGEDDNFLENSMKQQLEGES